MFLSRGIPDTKISYRFISKLLLRCLGTSVSPALNNLYIISYKKLYDRAPDNNYSLTGFIEEGAKPSRRKLVQLLKMSLLSLTGSGRGTTVSTLTVLLLSILKASKYPGRSGVLVI
jgi:hypothetical protein